MSEFSGHLAKYYDAANNEALAREENTSLRELKWIISELPSRQKFTETLADFWDVAVIAEHKRKSPSEGEIRPGSSVGWTVEQYKKGGAFAVSILTQGTHFGGKIDDLSDARYATDLPILRKDFISSSYQLHEARAFGANAVLLIVAGLSSSRLQDLHEEASSIGLDSLIEVHEARAFAACT
jgi:indole-3-glycerol phosphate synthase